jgi:ethanolamine utilization protein EutN
MKLGRVTGTVVTCAAYEGLEGVKFLVVQPLDKHRQPKGGTIVCCDASRQAGLGELVYWEGGREAAMALDPWFVPVDHSIIGIVDELAVDEGGES